MAIAVTLRVLNIDQPVPSRDVLARAARLTTLVGGVGSWLSECWLNFLIVARAWVGQHRLLAERSRFKRLLIPWTASVLLLKFCC